jgi:hypothetical protein
MLDPSFTAVVDGLHAQLDALLRCPPIRSGAFIGPVAKSGVYLFTENGRHLYVGRSNDIRKRYQLHCTPGATHNQASFAFRLAREMTGKRTVYKKGPDNRSQLVADPAFAQAFVEAKRRIREMEYRWVEEGDQTRQAMLEIYCSTVLKAPYNSFKTT